MKFNKLAVLIAGLASVFNIASKTITKTEAAESPTKYTEFKSGTQPSQYSKDPTLEYYNDEDFLDVPFIASGSDSSTGSRDNYYSYDVDLVHRAYTNVIKDSKDILGEEYSSKLTNYQNLAWGKSPVNYYKTSDNYNWEIIIGFNSPSWFQELSFNLDGKVLLPAIAINDVVLAYVESTETATNIITLSDVNVEIKWISYSIRPMGYISEAPFIKLSFSDDLVGGKNYIESISRIGSFDYRTEIPSGIDYIYSFKKGYCFDNMFGISKSMQYHFVASPYDIALLELTDDPQITLRHSYSGEAYGVYNNKFYLNKILLKITQGGEEKRLELSLVTKSELDNLSNTDYISENKMVFLSRGKMENEISRDNGGLISAYSLRNLTFDKSKSARIEIESMSFGKKNNGYVVLNSSDMKTINTKKVLNQNLTFGYYADKAVGFFHADVFQYNATDVDVWNYNHNTFIGWIQGIGSLGIVNLILYLAELNYNKEYKINRYAFNFTAPGNDNVKIENIVKMQYAFEKGHKEIKYNENGKPVPYDKDKLQIETIEPSDVHHYIDDDLKWFFDDHREAEGFVKEDIELGGTTYNYYYQNIYSVYNYENFINYMSPLSIWYETYEGQVIRLTSNKDGLHIVQDENGDDVIIDLDGNVHDDWTPEDVGSDIDNTDVDFDHTEDALSPEKEWWEKAFDSLKEMLDTLKRVGSIVLTLTLVAVLGFGILKVSTSLSTISANRSTIKSNKKKKKK